MTALWGGVPDELRPGLNRDITADVAIVGAGYTGLWTAYYLLGAEPGLRVAIVESEYAGFGASGRNGGWCSALFPTGLTALARESGREAAIAQYEAMIGSVAEVGRVVAAEDIACDWAVGGTVVLARSEAQLERAREETEEATSFGFDQPTLLDADRATARLNATDVRAATYTSHCAVVQPWQLARGLADAVTARGATIFEGTRATAIEPGRVQTARGTVEAAQVVRATEGYTAQLPGHERRIVPIYSLMIATEPLSEATWSEIGLAERETFADYRHLIIYGQRTADNRLVFGGRGAPYHFGSRIRRAYDSVPAVFDGLHRALVELLPAVADAKITHRWGGPLGVSRDWHASVGLQPSTGMAWAGGYVGDGVSTTNLAGRTLSALLLGTDDPLARLPWVGHLSPPWEPEPLRWIGANAALRVMQWSDRSEARRGRSSRLPGLVNRALGR
jgi:glycine/D-amino acid oxidase-like deaminating enzyme